MKILLKEIARLADVSPSAVSRVLNDNGYVSSEKRVKIEQLLIQNGYEVCKRTASNPFASKSVLVIADELGVSDAYIDYIRGIREKLLTAGYSMYLYLSGLDEQQSTREIEQVLASHKIGFAGILMISALDTPALRSAIALSKEPIVFLNRNLKGLDASAVILDNYKVGYFATQFLISKGYRKVIHLAGRKGSVASQERVRGYQNAMIDSGLQLETPSVIYGDHSYEKGYECGLDLARGKYRADAIFIASDRMALGFVDAIYEQGLSCPKDIGIICAEDTKILASGKIAMTTIGYNNRVIGRTAAELFLESLLHPTYEKKTVSFSPQIIERDSVSTIH